mgnify:CR=1 FL=1
MPFKPPITITASKRGGDATHDVHGEQHAGGGDLCRAGRAADLRRPRADRRQRAHQHRYDRARVADRARRSVQHVRALNESQRKLIVARAVPARADHRAAPRRGDDARSARDDRRIAAVDASATVSAPGQDARGQQTKNGVRHGPALRHRAADVLRATDAKNLFGKNRSFNVFGSVSLHLQGRDALPPARRT